MDERFKQILQTLPPKTPRSRLEPYCELIDELRRLGRTYQEITSILLERCELHISISALHEFVQARSRKNRKARVDHSQSLTDRVAYAQNAGGPMASARTEVAKDELRRRIAALRAERLLAQPAPERFQYDASEPLRLVKADSKNGQRE
jgi:hypothetical protein